MLTVQLHEVYKTLYLTLPDEVLKLLLDAHETYVQVASETGSDTQWDISTTIRKVMFNKVYDDPIFTEWVKKRVAQFIDHQEIIFDKWHELPKDTIKSQNDYNHFLKRVEDDLLYEKWLECEENDDEPVIEYRVTLLNIKHNRQEVYTTIARDSVDLRNHLRMLTDNGYSFVEAIPTDRIDEV